MSVLLSLALIVTASVTTIVLVVRAVFRRIRRSRTINGAVLKGRASLTWGPQRKVLALQLQLNDALESGRAAIDLAVRTNGRRGELPRIFRRIEAEGVALQAQLRLMETETDAAALADELPAAGLRVEQVSEMIRRLRASVAAGLGDPTGSSLASLRAEVDREVAALHAGVEELRLLNADDGRYPAPLRTTPTVRLQTKGAQS
ncbi:MULTISPECIES: hypothetical protein [unclassified Leifsonia]|uniref:hypothetical protein n=1 Tax=unclassified Leifsonia TaxID=2663824 RepID=UPI0006F9F66C|nr:MULTISPECIES: hypothetical protein [unclassified Leifsonia]KQX07607.1 hypothetical protein ASC59_07665 [Leifsonia sp. Root1293]KRA11889.1 hypothetical protein ASD61_07665 [Leifsonia sp. Root60]